MFCHRPDSLSSKDFVDMALKMDSISDSQRAPRTEFSNRTRTSKCQVNESYLGCGIFIKQIRFIIWYFHYRKSRCNIFLWIFWNEFFFITLWVDMNHLPVAVVTNWSSFNGIVWSNIVQCCLIKWTFESNPRGFWLLCLNWCCVTCPSVSSFACISNWLQWAFKL